MTISATNDLTNLLTLERIEANLFRGNCQDIGGKSVFGGQVLGQAINAAGQTVVDRGLHSLHGYFLLPGDMKAPVIYSVDRIRDGKSFSTRQITAIQHGKSIFIMTASFQIGEAGVEHQATMPDVPPPDNLPSTLDLRKRLADMDPDQLMGRPVRPLPIEIRPIQPANPYLVAVHPPIQRVWLRAVAPLPEDTCLHQAVLAYASDFGLLRTASLPHGISLRQKNIHAASVDHAMWFHRPFRADQWLLCDMESPSASGARGLAQGRFFNQEGVLIATVAQEGLIRIAPEK